MSKIKFLHILNVFYRNLNSPDNIRIWMIDNPVNDSRCKWAIFCPSARAEICLAHITVLLRDPGKTLQYHCTTTYSAQQLCSRRSSPTDWGEVRGSLAGCQRASPTPNNIVQAGKNYLAAGVKLRDHSKFIP